MVNWLFQMAVCPGYSPIDTVDGVLNWFLIQLNYSFKKMVGAQCFKFSKQKNNYKEASVLIK